MSNTVLSDQEKPSYEPTDQEKPSYEPTNQEKPSYEPTDDKVARRFGPDGFLLVERGKIIIPKLFRTLALAIGMSHPQYMVWETIYSYQFSEELPFVGIQSIADELNRNYRTIERTLRSMILDDYLAVSEVLTPFNKKRLLLDSLPLYEQVVQRIRDIMESEDNGPDSRALRHWMEKHRGYFATKVSTKETLELWTKTPDEEAKPKRTLRKKEENSKASKLSKAKKSQIEPDSLLSNSSSPQKNLQDEVSFDLQEDKDDLDGNDPSDWIYYDCAIYFMTQERRSAYRDTPDVFSSRYAKLADHPSYLTRDDPSPLTEENSSVLTEENPSATDSSCQEQKIPLNPLQQETRPESASLPPEPEKKKAAKQSSKGDKQTTKRVKQTGKQDKQAEEKHSQDAQDTQEERGVHAPLQAPAEREKEETYHLPVSSNSMKVGAIRTEAERAAVRLPIPDESLQVCNIDIMSKPQEPAQAVGVVEETVEQAAARIVENGRKVAIERKQPSRTSATDSSQTHHRDQPPFQPEVAALMSHFTTELCDDEHLLPSNQTWILRQFWRSGMDTNSFLQFMYHCSDRAKRQSNVLRKNRQGQSNRVPVFKHILKKELDACLVAAQGQRLSWQAESPAPTQFVEAHAPCDEGLVESTLYQPDISDASRQDEQDKIEQWDADVTMPPQQSQEATSYSDSMMTASDISAQEEPSELEQWDEDIVATPYRSQEATSYSDSMTAASDASAEEELSEFEQEEPSELEQWDEDIVATPYQGREATSYSDSMTVASDASAQEEPSELEQWDEDIVATPYQGREATSYADSMITPSDERSTDPVYHTEPDEVSTEQGTPATSVYSERTWQDDSTDQTEPKTAPARSTHRLTDAHRRRLSARESTLPAEKPPVIDTTDETFGAAYMRRSQDTFTLPFSERRPIPDSTLYDERQPWSNLTHNPASPPERKITIVESDISSARPNNRNVAGSSGSSDPGSDPGGPGSGSGSPGGPGNGSSGPGSGSSGPGSPGSGPNGPGSPGSGPNGPGSPGSGSSGSRLDSSPVPDNAQVMQRSTREIRAECISLRQRAARKAVKELVWVVDGLTVVPYERSCINCDGVIMYQKGEKYRCAICYPPIEWDYYVIKRIMAAASEVKSVEYYRDQLQDPPKDDGHHR